MEKKGDKTFLFLWLPLVYSMYLYVHNTSPPERHTHGGEIMSTAIPIRTNRVKALTPA